MSEITWKEAWDTLSTTDKSFSGSNWNEFWLIGSTKSIKEVHRLQNCEARMKDLEEIVREMMQERYG